MTLEKITLKEADDLISKDDARIVRYENKNYLLYNHKVFYYDIDEKYYYREEQIIRRHIWMPIRVGRRWKIKNIKNGT